MNYQFLLATGGACSLAREQTGFYRQLENRSGNAFSLYRYATKINKESIIARGYLRHYSGKEIGNLISGIKLMLDTERDDWKQIRHIKNSAFMLYLDRDLLYLFKDWMLKYNPEQFVLECAHFMDDTLSHSDCQPDLCRVRIRDHASVVFRLHD